MPSLKKTDALPTLPGLSLRESLVWRTLSDQPPLNVSQLAEFTKLHRPAMYAVLPELIKKELVKEVIEKRRILYTTTGQTAMKTWCIQQNQDLAAYFPHQEVAAQAKEITVFRGKEISQVWETIARELPKKAVFYRYDGYSPNINVKTYVPSEYIAQMNTKKLERFVITNQGLRQAAYKKRIECASRLLPGSFDAFDPGITQMMFGDKVAFVDLKNEIAFIIQNQAIATYHARLFQFLFRELPE